MAAANIKFPVLFYHWNQLNVDTEESFKDLGVKFYDSTFECIASAKPGFREESAWLLDANGTFYRLHPDGEKRAWARSLSRIIQLVKSKHRIDGPMSISVGDLLSLLEGVKDKYKEAPTARSLREHLRKYSPDRLVDRDLLDQWPI